MRNLSKISAVVLIATIAILAQIPTNGLVSFFPFSGNYKDATGTLTLDTTAAGSPSLIADRNSTPNTAYTFNGTVQAFKALNTAKLPSGNSDFTISAWIIKDNSGIPRVIVSWGTDTVGQSKEVVFYTASNLSYDLLGITNGIDSVSCEIKPYSTLRSWANVVITVKNGTAKMFINKTKVLEKSMTFSIQANGVLGIATDMTNPYSGINYLGGSMDDIAIYSRALTDSEVEYLYSCKSTLNSAPKITSTPVVTAKVSEQYSYTIMTQDLDNQTVTTFLSEKPNGMTISNNKISWTPTSAQTGKNSVTIIAKDVLGDSVKQSFEINVEAVQNKAPTITSTPVKTAKAGILYNYTVTATDPENETITITLSTKPTGMTITNNKISWTPTNAQAGKNSIKVLVKDASGNSTEQSFDIEVEPVTGVSPIMTPHRILPTQEIVYFLPNGKTCKGVPTTKMLIVSHNVKRIIVR